MTAQRYPNKKPPFDERLMIYTLPSSTSRSMYKNSCTNNNATREQTTSFRSVWLKSSPREPSLLFCEIILFEVIICNTIFCNTQLKHPTYTIRFNLHRLPTTRDATTRTSALSRALRKARVTPPRQRRRSRRRVLWRECRRI